MKFVLNWIFNYHFWLLNQVVFSEIFQKLRHSSAAYFGDQPWLAENHRLKKSKNQDKLLVLTDTFYKIVIFRPQKCIIPQKILRKIDIQSLNNVWGLFSYKKINKKNRITPWVKIFQGIFCKRGETPFPLKVFQIHMTFYLNIFNFGTLSFMLDKTYR